MADLPEYPADRVRAAIGFARTGPRWDTADLTIDAAAEELTGCDVCDELREHARDVVRKEMGL